ncbi:uncharacterized protein MYCFIDRAFT_206925 [Pseudocercospora fijiensis CIRAD86]|uniref:Uncharacterized protein n=1 Tax=Pseudocercospora fijiensis (strain CIRAD86) TaxID=383855 RepID=M2ZA64_PSEFD|nr:uncharacterized protein MYCFIDRAFT_206925 [Pseudocercospora fijiensis CIRAD86]EME86725.1 hypothetical protein MYCFIDRAFT_206925 [Pseudocercospora fijiensis CIRAD86]
MDDSMEMSSPARNHDGDIDIDFDDYGGVVHFTDDERMLEDGEQARPGTATDDMMADDDAFNLTSNPVVEAEMQDDEPYQHQDGDEELIDYDEAELQDHIPDPDAIPTETVSVECGHTSFPVDAETAAKAAATEEVVDEEIPRQLEEPHAEPADTFAQPEEPVASEETVSEPVVEPTVQQPVSTELEPVHETSNHNVATQYETEGEENRTEIDASQAAAAAVEWDEEALEAALDDDFHQAEEPAQKAPPQLSGTIDTSAAAFSVDAPPTPTDTGLHPMVIQFGDHEWPLFKSRAQPDGLLKDDNLVNVSLAELLSSCKQRLNQRLGDAVSEDQDLVLGFDRIGLMLMECSTHASAISLNDVLEVYMNLYQNDGVEDIPRLSMTLTTQLKFTSHLKLLKEAAVSGTGMSTYNSTHDQGDVEEYDEEDDEGEQEEDGQEYPTEAHYEQAEHTEDDVARRSTQNVEERQEEGQDYHEYQEGDENGQEYSFDQYEEGNYDDYDENAVHDQDATGTGDAHVSEIVTAETFNEGHETVAPDSTATSATVRADATNDAGKYPTESDYDFDYDLTALTSESHENGGDDEFSALLDAYDEEARQADAAETAQHAVDDTADHAAEAHQDGEEAGHDGTYTLDDTGEFVNEDFAEYAQGEGDDQAEGTGSGEHESADVVEPGAQHEKQDFVQADNIEHDQQPGEDEDQFHTAFDLLDETEFEEGQEAAQQEPHAEGTNEPLPDEENNNFYDGIQKPSLPAEDETPNGSLRGKRSFDEHADEDELNFDEHESKKPRAD